MIMKPQTELISPRRFSRRALRFIPCFSLFCRKVDGSYLSLNPSLNQNFTYYDTVILSSSKTIELLFSELPAVLATTNVAIHDNAETLLALIEMKMLRIEIINLDRIVDNNYSYTSDYFNFV